ncbi:hypothetical protein D3C78_894430 [compost metagenome]
MGHVHGLQASEERRVGCHGLLLPVLEPLCWRVEVGVLPDTLELTRKRVSDQLGQRLAADGDGIVRLDLGSFERIDAGGHLQSVGDHRQLPCIQCIDAVEIVLGSPQFGLDQFELILGGQCDEVTLDQVDRGCFASRFVLGCLLLGQLVEPAIVVPDFRIVECLAQAEHIAVAVVEQAILFGFLFAAAEGAAGIYLRQHLTERFALPPLAALAASLRCKDALVFDGGLLK